MLQLVAVKVSYRGIRIKETKMIEWLFAAIKVYAIGFGVFFVLVAGIAVTIFISVMRDMHK